MTKLRYRIIAKTAFLVEHGKYRTYGLQVKIKKTDGWKRIKVIHDITTKRKKAKKMARLFTANQLSLVHFYDVLEDMLP